MRNHVKDLRGDWYTQRARAHRLQIVWGKALSDPEIPIELAEQARQDFFEADRQSEDAWNRYRLALDVQFDRFTYAALVVGAFAGFLGGALVAVLS